MEVSHKIKNKSTTWSSNHISGYISKGNDITISERYLRPHVCNNIIHNSQDIETT